MPAIVVRNVGTITSVREVDGMAVEKSIRGSARGATNSVASQFTSATASWLVASTAAAT